MEHPEYNPEEYINQMAQNGVGGAVSLNDDPSEDRALSVRFYLDPRPNDAKSKQAGRLICDEVEVCEIRIPGSTDTIRNVVSDKERGRFPKQYAAFQNSQSQDAVSGTPLGEWAQITRSQVEEMRFFGIRTVEHLAGLADSNIQRLGPGWQETRQKAKDWLNRAEAGAPLARLRGEVEELRSLVKTQNEMLAKQAQEIALARGGVVPSVPVQDPMVQQLMAQVQAMALAMAAKPAEAPKRRGRPPKNPQPSQPE